MLCAMPFMFPDCIAGFIVSESIFHLICRLKREEVSEVVRCWLVDMPKDTATISQLQEVSGSSPRKCGIMVRTLLVVFSSLKSMLMFSSCVKKKRLPWEWNHMTVHQATCMCSHFSLKKMQISTIFGCTALQI